MRYIWVMCLLVLLAAPAAFADSSADCNQDSDDNLSIKGCSELIARNPRNATAYYNRGGAGTLDTALWADFVSSLRPADSRREQVRRA